MSARIFSSVVLLSFMSISKFVNSGELLSGSEIVDSVLFSCCSLYLRIWWIWSCSVLCICWNFILFICVLRFLWFEDSSLNLKISMFFVLGRMCCVDLLPGLMFISRVGVFVFACVCVVRRSRPMRKM